MSHPHRHALLPLVALVGAFATVPGRAADHANLEEGIPIRIEDAYPTSRNAIELQGYVRYERVRNDEGRHDRFELAPRIDIGAARNLQVSIGSPYRLGDAPETSQGDASVEALYNFNSEGLAVPAMSLAAGVERPYGAQSGGTETTFKFLATKSLGAFGESYVPRRVNFNLAWMHNWNPLDEERRDRYLVGVGYHQPVANDWVVAADIYREQSRMKDGAMNVAEIGLRYQLSPVTVLAVAVGAARGDDAPRGLVTFGFQHTLKGW